MKTGFLFKKDLADPELASLHQELRRAQRDLAASWLRFNQAVDPELIESCIYQINADKARCNYLIRAVKARSPHPLSAGAREGDALWT